MKRKIMTLAMTILAVAALCGTLHSQDDIKALSDPAFENSRRAAVPFMHDKHNGKAKITECNACHHGSKDGKLDPAGDSTGTKCSECHTVKGDKGAMPLMRAYHRQCGDCHESKAAGPVTCGQCHPREGA
ncbi:MAG: acidic tetraheme cytochrome c3 TmcA [Thermodesulfobacteriota bacterium]